jgi:hypothetical protein
MIESLAARKAVELDNKLASLDAEMRHWEWEASGGRRLEKHHTQVHAVAGGLAVPVAALRARLAELDGVASLGRAGEIEAMILELHRIWDVFRGKLARRYVEHFAGYLSGADELAYRCYRPAELRGAPREPPLVFFGGDLSPLTRLRGARPDALERLPVALIGLPWFQVEHLPDVPIVAHEVGHDVEADLALGPALDAAVDGALVHAGAPVVHRRAWATWRREAFADVFGTLALGPAFTRTLIDFLAAEPRTIAGQWQTDPAWWSHPPSTLRVLVSAAALELMGDGAYAAEAGALRSFWSSAYPTHAMACFEPDVPMVAAALVNGPYAALENGRLTDLLTFAPASQERAERIARDALKRVSGESTDARELVAAARLAFDAAPRAFRAAEVSPRLLRRIRESQTVGTRAGTASSVAAGVREERSRRAGEWLTDYLEERHVQARHA